MSSAAKVLPYYTYNEWKHWQDRWELIDGVPYAMSPSPLPKHQRIATALSFEFELILRKAKCSCSVYQPIDYKVAEDTILQPDLLIVCKPINKAFLDFPPALVVEILSPSTAMKDRNNKFTIYQQQQIPYYLIVDTDKEIIEVYSLNEEGIYTLQLSSPDGSYNFHLTEHCKSDVDLSNVWKQ
jgi:Uma2 family endonuclease